MSYQTDNFGYRLKLFLGTLASFFILLKKKRRAFQKKISLWGAYTERFYHEDRFTPAQKRAQKLVMTLLVRDEAPMIEAHLKFHLAQGVDKIIVTDNGSVDGTTQILEKYEQHGYVHLIKEPATSYEQAKWVHRMIELAIHQYQADWIINSDADEFFLSHTENLKDALPVDQKPNVLVCWWRFSLPRPGEKFFENIYFYEPHTSNPKAIHTAQDYIKIHKGNHKVDMRCVWKPAVSEDITLYHLQDREFAGFCRRIKYRYEQRQKLGQKINPTVAEAYHTVVQVPPEVGLKNYNAFLLKNITTVPEGAKLIEDHKLKNFFEKSACLSTV